MKAIAKVLMVIVFVFAAAALFVPVSAQAPGAASGQSDHALFLSAAAGDTAIYCGLGTKVEPWILHVSASNPAFAAATLTITFGDTDAIGFLIPQNGSFSMTQAMGGVPGVDDAVKITTDTNGVSIMASAEAKPGAEDIFTGDDGGADTLTTDDDEVDNFCLTKPGDDGTVPF